MDPRLAEKLLRYRSSFEFACAGLFGGTQTVTVEYDDDDEASTVTRGPRAGEFERPFENSNDRSNSNAGSNGHADGETPSVPPDCAAVRAEVEKAVCGMAQDFAADFNAYLEKMAKEDSSTAQIAPRYVMGAQHISDLESAFAEPVVPLVETLERSDVEAARRAAADVWPTLEKRIREKWQAYFVMTFQDVSVERKAARDRRKLQPRIDPAAAELMATADAARRALPDFDAAGRNEPRPRAVTPWLVVAAALLAAALGAFLLLRSRAPAPAPTTAPTETAPPATAPSR